MPGCRVKVRFAGRDVGGFVARARSDESEPAGRLSTAAPRRVSPEPVLSPEVLAVARLVADRYAGTLADVLRLAVPPRHARVEGSRCRPADRPSRPAGGGAGASGPPRPAGSAWVDRLAAGRATRAPSGAPPRARTGRPGSPPAPPRPGGRGEAACCWRPDARDVARLDRRSTACSGRARTSYSTADLGPAARYRAFLARLAGQVDIVVGTRAAAFAPVRELGLVAIWDDGDDLYAEPRAPYPHAREVLAMRAYQERAGTAPRRATAGRSRPRPSSSRAGPASSARPREAVRAAAPQVHVTGETDDDLARDEAARSARMPAQVFTVVREGLRVGPVLVHTPRYGYQPALACARCRTAGALPACGGPLRRGPRAVRARSAAGAASVADVVGLPATAAGTTASRPVVGSVRTAEEWGRAFPQVPVDRVRRRPRARPVDDQPAIVVATPGAEPEVGGGYAAAVLLDTWLTLSMAGLRAEEEALRRWMRVAALVRPARRRRPGRRGR